MYSRREKIIKKYNKHLLLIKLNKTIAITEKDEEQANNEETMAT